ncbi:MAG: hypothetical protein KF757_00080 [Phycisphaeraceae bacterium]|nr:hypothetical protein [Phycisphaeraceae bacterium]
MLRDRDTTANGTLDERVYYLHNWRSDIVALISHAGSQIEQVRYEPYGTPFGIPAGDIDADGKVTQDDVDQAAAWYSGSAYDVRADLDMNGSVNLSDITYIAGNKVLNHETGRGVLSLEHIGSRKGYAGYENLAELEGSGVKWDVRNRVLLSEIGSWNRRDPLGYVDGVSLYEYVMGRPILGYDTYGTHRAFAQDSTPMAPWLAPPSIPIVDAPGGDIPDDTTPSMVLLIAACEQACQDNRGAGAMGYCYKGKPVVCICRTRGRELPGEQGDPFRACQREYELDQWNYGSQTDCAPGYTGLPDKQPHVTHENVRVSLCRKALSLRKYEACVGRISCPEGNEGYECREGRCLLRERNRCWAESLEKVYCQNNTPPVIPPSREEETRRNISIQTDCMKGSGQRCKNEASEG